MNFLEKRMSNKHNVFGWPVVDDIHPVKSEFIFHNNVEITPGRRCFVVSDSEYKTLREEADRYADKYLSK